MAKSLYFNTNASSPAVALVKGVSTTSPLGTKPEFVLGDNRDFNIYLVDGAGNYDAASGAAGYTLKLAIGDPGASPTGGTFRLGVSSATSGSLQNTYHYIIYDYQAGDDFTNVGAASNATGVIFTKNNGLPNDWTNGSTLIEVTHALDYNTTAALIQTALNATYEIGASGVAVSGTSPNFRVTWAAAGARYNTTVHANALTPDSSVIVTEETVGDGSTVETQLIELKQQPVANQYSWSTITNGWTARLNCNTFAFRQALAGAETVQRTLELQVTDSGGNEYTYVQVPVTIRHQVIDDAALEPTTLDTAISETDAYNAFVQNRATVTGLTGGGATNLDGIATADGAATTGWLAAVKTSDTTLSIYRLVSGTDAEASPTVIRPDDYATTTNERVWKLQTVNTAGFFTTETISAFSSAGNDDITLPNNGVHHVAFATADAGAGTYTRTLALVTTNATTGDLIDVRISFAASVNPTVEVRNATSGGTLLTTATGDGSTGVVHGVYQYTGSAWVEVGAYWI